MSTAGDGLLHQSERLSMMQPCPQWSGHAGDDENHVLPPMSWAACCFLTGPGRSTACSIELNQTPASAGVLLGWQEEIPRILTRWYVAMVAQASVDASP